MKILLQRKNKNESENCFCLPFRTLRIFWDQKLNLATFGRGEGVVLLVGFFGMYAMFLSTNLEQKNVNTYLLGNLFRYGHKMIPTSVVPSRARTAMGVAMFQFLDDTLIHENITYIF